MKILLLGHGIANDGCKRLLEKHSLKYDYLNIDELIDYEYDLIISAPSVSIYNDIFKKITGKIISDFELANMLEKHFFIGVTGSNGKTTVSSMLYHILNKKYNCILCGNIGYSIGDALVDNPNADIYIVELSSFQLEKTNIYSPNIGVILNIFPSHLDHHINMKNYIDAKLKICKFQTENNYCIYNKNNPYLQNIDKSIKSKLVPFSINTTLCDIYYLGEYVYYKNKRIFKINKNDINKKHLIENYLAVLSVLSILKFNLNKACKYLKTFKGIKYRLEKINDYIYNDAKSTNCASTNAALKSLKNVCLICGGYDRGNDIYLDNEAISNISVVYCYGDVKDKLYKYFNDKNIKCMKYNTLNEAFNDCAKKRIENQIILYSPMHASFDQYKSYIQRGEEFEDLCKSIITK